MRRDAGSGPSSLAMRFKSAWAVCVSRGRIVVGGGESQKRTSNRKMQRMLQPQTIPSIWRQSYSVEEKGSVIKGWEDSRERLRTRKKRVLKCNRI
jgi:hypothetical protein